VNPYLSFSIAMCVIVLIALAGTAYMAVFFNRRAKSDLAAALQPLTEVVAGEADVEEALVKGRFSGHLAEGRVAQLPGGMGRVFQSSVIDGAGGSKWTWTVSRSKDGSQPDAFDFDGPAGDLKTRLLPSVQTLAREPSLAGGWFRVEYDPAPGHIRLTRPMRVRRDLPNAEAFRVYLDSLVEIADLNRAVQQPLDQS
jgi:hypothetical protein